MSSWYVFIRGLAIILGGGLACSTTDLSIFLWVSDSGFFASSRSGLVLSVCTLCHLLKDISRLPAARFSRNSVADVAGDLLLLLAGFGRVAQLTRFCVRGRWLEAVLKTTLSGKSCDDNLDSEAGWALEGFLASGMGGSAFTVALSGAVFVISWDASLFTSLSSPDLVPTLSPSLNVSLRARKSPKPEFGWAAGLPMLSARGVCALSSWSLDSNICALSFWSWACPASSWASLFLRCSSCRSSLYALACISMSWRSMSFLKVLSSKMTLMKSDLVFWASALFLRAWTSSASRSSMFGAPA